MEQAHILRILHRSGWNISQAASTLGIDRSADLFIPIFTFIFGEAQLNGEAAIVSGLRLQNESYGMIAKAAVDSDRLYKECTHELGHTFGLRHCLSFGCAIFPRRLTLAILVALLYQRLTMNKSPSVERHVNVQLHIVNSPGTLLTDFYQALGHPDDRAVNRPCDLR